MPDKTQIGGNDKNDRKIYAYNDDDYNKISLENVIADNIRLKIKDNVDNTKITMKLPINSTALVKLFDNYTVKKKNE